MYKHFASGLTPDEIKQAYRTLCKQYHPDLHPGDTSVNWVALMQEINAEYAVASAEARRADEPKRRADKKWAPPTSKDYDDLSSYDERIREAIEKIITFHNLLDIEVCNLWVWVDGTKSRGTSPENDAALNALRAAGYMWAPSKKRWYFAGVPAKHKHAPWTMNRIRTVYGSDHVHPSTDSTSKTTAGRIS